MRRLTGKKTRRLTGKKTRRLTGKKNKRPISNLDLIERLCSREEAETISIQNAFSKLSKIEDIEEEIKMSLVDFYKCITSNEEEFYIIVEDEDNEQLEIVEVLKKDESMHYFIQGKFYFIGESKDGFYYEYPISSYGEDLFLTLEEAEKKLEEIINVNKE